MSESMNVGFTGSRQGIKLPQEEGLIQLLADLYENRDDQEFHHGNCVGADERALDIARDIGYWTVAHPANGLERLQLPVFGSDKSRNYRAPQTRNKNIVNETDHIIACPKETVEPPVRRGQGTWSVVRYARKVGKPLTIIWPDGTLKEEHG